jgi:hypothetical protein
MRALFLHLAAAVLACSAAAAQQPAYQPPRTPDGHVDFQGVWTNYWMTPLERLPESSALIVEPSDAVSLSDVILKRYLAGDPIQAQDDYDPLSLLKIDGQLRSSLVIDPQSGLLPYTAEGQARRNGFVPNRLRPADHPEQRGNNERCLGISSSFAPFLTAPISNIRQIIQTRDHVVIYSEHYIIVRIIPFADRPAMLNDRHGAAKAGWDGDTLVVESTGFRPDDAYRFVPLSVMIITPSTRITERFTRTSANEILYRFTVEDPLLYSRPWTAETVFKAGRDRMFEYACHEGNYGLPGILSGGRAKDRLTAAKAP